MRVGGTSEDLKRQLGGSLRVSIADGGRTLDAFASFGNAVREGDTLNIITGPERINEILELALRERLPARVGPVTLEEAFLRVVGRSIDEE